MTTIIQTENYPDNVGSIASAAALPCSFEFYDDTFAGRALRAINCEGSVALGGPYVWSDETDYVYVAPGGGPVVFYPTMETGCIVGFGASIDGGPGYFRFELEIETAVGSGTFVSFGEGTYGADVGLSTGGGVEQLDDYSPTDPPDPDPSCFWDHDSMLGVSEDC